MNKCIYKKDNRSRIRFCEVITKNGEVFHTTGLLEGKGITKSFKVKPKNIGKVNETTIEQQAHLEGNAIITKKLKEGYFATLKEAQSSNIIMPMLAHSFNDKTKVKINWSKGAIVQRKFDGMRCLAMVDKLTGDVILLSRKNRLIETLPHINESLTQFFEEHNDVILDGELYAEGISFQDNMKLIKKHRDESIQINFHIYDTFTIPNNESFETRSNFLQKHSGLLNKSNYIKLVRNYKVKGLDEVEGLHNQFVVDGYEGAMIRHGYEPYKINGRSFNLLKYKNFQDITATVIDIEPFEKDPSQGKVVLDGYTANLKMSHELRQEILLNKADYIGQTAEIRFFEYTDGGIPRFPVCVGFRLDK